MIFKQNVPNAQTNEMQSYYYSRSAEMRKFIVYLQIKRQPDRASKLPVPILHNFKTKAGVIHVQKLQKYKYIILYIYLLYYLCVSI